MPDKIRGANLRLTPYPHFVADGVLDPAMLSKAQALWPDPAPYSTEAPGNFLLYLGTRDARAMRAMNPEQRVFWREVIDLICDDIVPATLERYGEWITDRYPGLRNIEFDALSLMQTDARFTQHGVHTHHWHDPTWLFTNLIYIDDSGENRGTSIYRVAANDDASVAARTRHWLQEEDWNGNPDLSLTETVSFVPNRLFSFYETPISYHGVEKYPPSEGRRRVIRMHVRAPRTFTRKLYGVSPKAYKALRERDNQSSEVIAWMRRDIDQMHGKSGKLVPVPAHIHRIRTTANKAGALGLWLFDKLAARVIA